MSVEVVVGIAGLKNNTLVFFVKVGGKTYPHKDTLKALGFKWDGEGWVFKSTSPREIYQKIAELDQLGDVRGDNVHLMSFAKKLNLIPKSTKVKGRIHGIPAPEFVKKYIL